MRLLVCGPREWTGVYGDIRTGLLNIAREVAVCTVIHGGCSRYVGGVQVSVGMLADIAATDIHGASVEPYPVDHTLDGPWPAAGPRRNARMLRVGRPDRGLAFGALWRLSPPSKRRPLESYRHIGTGDMVTLILAARLPVRWVAAPGVTAVDLTEMPAPGEGMR